MKTECPDLSTWVTLGKAQSLLPEVPAGVKDSDTPQNLIFYAYECFACMYV